MKNNVFHIPGLVRIEYQRHREGPKDVFVLWVPNTARSFQSKDALTQHFIDHPDLLQTADNAESVLGWMAAVTTADTVSTADTATGT